MTTPEFIEIRTTDNIASAVRFSRNIHHVHDELSVSSQNRDISCSYTIEKQVEQQQPKQIDGIGELYVLYYIKNAMQLSYSVQEIYVLVRTVRNDGLHNATKLIEYISNE